MGEHSPIAFPLLPLDPPLIKEYFVELAVWLVVVVGIAVAMDFILPSLVLSGIRLFIFQFRRKVEGVLARTPAPP